MQTNSRVIGSAGFTLYELLITIAVIGVLAAVGLPAMGKFVQNYQASNAAGNLVASLNYARSEAIKEDISPAAGGVTVCASTGTGALATCDTASWAKGWIVSTPGTPAAPGAAVLQQVGALPTNLKLTFVPANPTIVFSPNGTVTGLVAAANGRVMITLCDPRGATYAREVEVSITGIIQASSQPGKDVSGAALACP